MKKYQKIAFLFPGQGAQYPGMGKDFVEQFPAAKHCFEEADECLNRKLSHTILQGPQEILTETRNSQTAIYVTSLAMLRVLHHQFPQLQPAVCSGLSLGEYTALQAAGWISFEKGLKLVDHRGHFMNDACISFPGTMAVIMGLEAQQVEDLVRSVNMPNDLWSANFNCPGQVVISGTHRGIEAGSEAAKAVGAKRILPLQVHGAFHSGLMLQAKERLTPHLLEMPFTKSFVPVVMNVTGQFVQEVDEIREMLIQQVTSPVRWEQGIRAMNDQGVDLYIEIGCGKTLAGMNRKIGVQAPTISIEKVADLELLAKEVA